jgi:RNA polymerase sigma-70 factor (ECF subfamily)
VEDPADADRRLVRAAAAGSSDALADLYDRHAPMVFGLASRITGRQEDAEEVVQDVFAQIWKQAARYEGGRGTVAAWIVILTRTRAIDRLRARAARPDQGADVAPDGVSTLMSGAPDPEHVTLSSEEAGHIRRALRDLPTDQRSLVELAYYDGLTHSEIARQTGVALGTVKTRIRTAMTTLREALRAGPRPNL